MLLVVGSLAIPAAALALILAHQSHHRAATAAGVPSTTLGPGADPSKARVGTVAPDFTLPSTTGRSVSLRAFRGRPVVVVFFASWCEPCSEELPVLEQYARADAARLRVVGVSFQDLPSDSRSFARRLHLTFPALLDDFGDPVAQRYGVLEVPQTLFVDARGIVLGRVFGQTTRRELAPAITDLLHDRPIRAV